LQALRTGLHGRFFYACAEKMIDSF